VRNALKADLSAEWKPLKGHPFENVKELQLMSVLGNVTEFESRIGKRYRRINQDGKTQWFSLWSNQIMKRATRARLQVCCQRMQRYFGRSIDRLHFNSWRREGSSGPVCIFEKNRNGNAPNSNKRSR